ncbi:MAG: MobC family replication-relaxation protein [Methylophilaceae bacterium]
MDQNSNLIADATLRISRRHAKHYAVLRFLRQHLWSSQQILQDVMNLQSRQAAHKSLMQMRVEGLIQSHLYEALGGNITLWGITAHGQAMAFNPHNEEPYATYFEPSRVSEQTIRHQLDLQKLRVIAEKNGWSEWLDGDRLGFLKIEIKRPDALVKDHNSMVIAIECERTFKTQKRYQQILVSYLRLLKSGQISKVVWVLPSKGMEERLRKIITGINSVSVAGQKIQIDPLKHHVNLHFCAYSDWPHYE